MTINNNWHAELDIVLDDWAKKSDKKIILNSANDEKMKVVNQKNLDKIFVNLKDSKTS